MRGRDSINEVLDFAIDREIEANRFYMDLAGRAENVLFSLTIKCFRDTKMARNEKTSKRVGKIASQQLRSKRTSKKAKSAAVGRT